MIHFSRPNPNAGRLQCVAGHDKVTWRPQSGDGPHCWYCGLKGDTYTGTDCHPERLDAPTRPYDRVDALNRSAA